MEAGLAERIGQVREAERRLLAGVAGMPDADVAAASLCPGWTIGHVLSHVARGADALGRAVDGARRGELVPMYASEQARAADIEAGAGRPAAELAADVEEAAGRLHRSWSAIGPDGWERPVPHRILGHVPVRGTIGHRWFEVEIHHVDLDRGYRPADWPPPFVSQLLERAVPTLARRLPDGVSSLCLRATDSGDGWSGEATGPDRAGPGGGAAEQVTVSGPSWAVAAWLIGRAAPAAASLSVTSGELPVLAPWG